MPKKTPARRTSEGDSDSTSRGERLQKVLAAAGLGSRRDCEELILAGRVTVDRQVVTELGTRVDPTTQDVRVDGEALRQPKRLYFAVNKPPGVVTTNSDPSGRPLVIDLVPTEERVFAVGRLDRASEGLILVTNDGEFANRLTHPRYGVEKTYLVRVAGSPDQKQLAQLRKGVHLAEGFARVDSVAVKRQQGKSTDMTIVLSEGRNREIRRILARVGHKVLALKRVAVGHVKLADLPSGGWRRLMPDEVQGLLALAKQKRRKAKAGDRRQATGVREQGAGVKSQGGEGRPAEPQYVQKAALLAQPLSLDDLLGDDLDEGPLTPEDFAAESHESPAADTFRGAVIGDPDEFTPQPQQQRPRDRRGSKHERRPGARQARESRPLKSQSRKAQPRDSQPRDSQPRESQSRESQPRESFGKKRTGKRTFGPRPDDRGTAGAKTGKVRFGAKGKKPRPKTGRPATGRPPIEGTDNQRRGKRRFAKKGQQAQGGKRFGQAGGHKSGGKRKGRR